MDAAEDVIRGVRDAAPYANHPAEWSSNLRGVEGAAPYNGR